MTAELWRFAYLFAAPATARNGVRAGQVGMLFAAVDTVTDCVLKMFREKESK